MKDRYNTLVAGFAFIVSFVVYFITMAPSVSFWDCGEFIACSVILGIPHPPGAPLFLMMGKVMTFLPFGADDAFRVNMISVIVSATTVMLLYLIIVRLIREFAGNPDTTEKKISRYGGGLLGALTFAFTDTFWFNATEAEVYALSMLFTALCLWLTLKWMEGSKELQSMKYLIACSYLFGLAVGVHLLNLLVIPSIFLLIFFYNRILVYNFLFLILGIFVVIGFIIPLISAVLGFSSSFPGVGTWLLAAIIVAAIYFAGKMIDVNYKLWTVITILMVVGVSSYIMIYLRANLGPVINENDPSTFQQFVSYWNRDQYGQESLITTMFPRRADFFGYQINKMYLRYFAWNFIGKGTTIGADNFIVESFSPKGLFYMPFLLGIVGIWYHFKKDWRRAFAVASIFVITGIAIIVYLNQPDPQPRERDYVYIGSFFAFSIWIGMSIGGVIELSRRFLKNRYGKKVGYAGIIGMCTVMGPYMEFKHNFHEHDRRGNYMAWDYSHNILESCEPDAIIFTNGDNDTFPLWYLQEVEGIRKDVSIVNLSLLNTVWYIKQLKYGNPGVPVSLSDVQIDNIGHIPWNERIVTFPVPAERYNNLIQDVHGSFRLGEIENDTTISFQLKPTISQPGSVSGIRIQDRMVEHIIRENRWERPVYFAITVSTQNKLGLDNYLRIDGLALKLVPYSASNLAVDKLTKNLMETFNYRGINDPDVYHNKQAKDLLQNLRLSFFSVANFYAVNGMAETAVDMLDALENRVPADLIPFSNYQVLIELGRVYVNGGELEQAGEMFNRVLEREDLDDQMRVEVARSFAIFLKDYDRAIEICKAILEDNPFEPNAYSILVTSLRENKNYDEAIRYLNEWLGVNPDDTNARTIVSDIEQLSAAADTSRN